MAEQLLPLRPELRANDAGRTPLAGGSVLYVRTGTFDPALVFADPAATVALPNPVQSDGTGALPSTWTTAHYAVDAFVYAADGRQIDHIIGVARVGQRPFVSAEQSIASAAARVMAHGLAAVPVGLSLALVCKEADAGYVVGDRIATGLNASTADVSRFTSAKLDAVNVTLRYSDAASVFAAAHAATGVATALINSRWTLVVTAHP